MEDGKNLSDIDWAMKLRKRSIGYIKEKRKCRICHVEEETWEYVWEVCGRSEEEEEGWQVNIGRILGDKGQGEYSILGLSSCK
ncbi:hypothetical protein K0M31_008882 [Melipona bicolor]|uniref:Uncharacterized protein n=1 Tax=Melipona bicolor TaxID=60889 RepID=A0AA40FQ08_9HYME|nr:hypothetical protein K0M31_008882 [Melipona bicolor]